MRTKSLRGQGKPGFTLIELLVVIAVVALLIALLLPSIERARRSARILLCSSNLKQFAMGLTSWSADDERGHYPPHYSWSPDIVWSGSSIYGSMGANMNRDPRIISKYSFLDRFLDVVAGQAGGDILWCPLDTDFRPNPQSPIYPNVKATTDPRYGDAYRNWYPTADYYNIGYVRFAAWQSLIAVWDNSGNADPTGPVMAPAGSRDVILADFVMSEMGHGGIDNHAYVQTDYTTHDDNNVAFSDGHVENHVHQFTDPGPPPFWRDHYLQYINGTYWLY